MNAMLPDWASLSHTKLQTMSQDRTKSNENPTKILRFDIHMHVPESQCIRG